MKPKKKTLMVVSFALGSLIFATSALADIASKSGYDQLKDSLKNTAAQCSDTLNNYTLDSSFVMKDNGKTLTFENTIRKVDRTKNTEEANSVRKGIVNDSTATYSYSDPSTQIVKNAEDQTYYVTEFTDPRKLRGMTNPFANDRAADLERIADAVVGSLKEQVMLTENPDGTKEFRGSLNEVQIPTLINALASFQIKQQFNGRNAETPALAQDIFVKEVNGSAHVNAEGILEGILGTFTIMGKDTQGNQHEITFEFLVKLSDINTSVVTKPDLTGQKVQKQVTTRSDGPGFTHREAFIGKFSNDIVTEKNGKFIKTGERVIEITQIDSTHAVGTYSEKYKPGFEDQTAAIADFSFDAAFNNDEKSDPYGATFIFTNASVNKMQGNIHFDENLGKIYFNFNRMGGGQPFDSSFSPDIE